MMHFLKKGLVVALAFCPALLSAQSGPFEIKGQLSGISAPAKVLLSYSVKGIYKRDSVEVKDGQFAFKGIVGEPVIASLLLKRPDTEATPGFRDMQTFFLEPGVITVLAKDSMLRATVSGGAANKAYREMRDASQSFTDQRRALSAAMKAATPEQKKDTAYQHLMEAKGSTIGMQEKQALANFVKTHPNTVVSFQAINAYAGIIPDVHDVEPLYELLSKEVQQTEQGKQWAATIAKLRAISIGATAPLFMQPDTSGNPVQLASLRGKYVLVDFWASWCKPCRAENPVVIRAYNKYKEHNFTVLGVSIDIERQKAAWLKAITDDQLPWLQVSDLKMKNVAAELYDVHAIPQNFLLDPQGKIVAKNLRGEELEKKLEELFGKI